MDSTTKKVHVISFIIAYFLFLIGAFLVKVINVFANSAAIDRIGDASFTVMTVLAMILCVYSFVTGLRIKELRWFVVLSVLMFFINLYTLIF